MRHLTLACVLFLAAAALSVAQPLAEASIAGRITDPAGAPIPEVRVMLTGASGPFEILTDLAGYYLFPGLRSGRYTLKAELPGAASRL